MSSINMWFVISWDFLGDDSFMILFILLYNEAEQQKEEILADAANISLFGEMSPCIF